LALAEQLIASHKEDQARRVLGQVSQAHPDLRRARALRDALGWPRAGRLALAPSGSERHPPRLRRAFWPDRCAFVWVRFAPAKDRERIVAEAAVQASLLVPGVAPALGHGPAADENLFVAFVAEGSPLTREAALELDLPEALALALEAVGILRAVAALGFELPD